MCAVLVLVFVKTCSAARKYGELPTERREEMDSEFGLKVDS